MSTFDPDKHLGEQVELLYADKQVRRRGKAISWTDRPSVTVEYDDGTRESWRADMVRPVPLVELPTEPTLGWLSWDTGNEGGREVAEWMRNGDGVFGGASRVPVAGVTEFREAVAVPKAALDELREAEARAEASGDTYARNYMRKGALRAFLAAVDEANGGDS